jgi:hypothetical protein
MAIPITGSGSLFVRLGHWLAILLDINAARGSAVTAPDYTVLIPTKVKSNVITDYANGTAIPELMQGSPTPRGVIGPGAVLPAFAAWQSQQATILKFIKDQCVASLIDMANTDTPQPNLSLQNAMALLVAQLAGNYNVAASSVSVGAQTNGVPAPNATYPSNGNGNSGPVVVVSVKDGKGYQLDNCLAETLTVTTTKDAQSGGQTKWSEPYSVAGQADTSGGDVLSPLWPSGSGKTITGTYVNAALNNSGGNLLQNSEFTTFTTANQADNWTYVTGSAGTSAGNIGQSNTGFQDTSCLEFFGDGATLHKITQSFNTTPSTSAGAGGTLANLLTLPDVPFAVNLWIKCSAIPTAGVFQIDLIDGSGSIINDDAGNANTKTVDLTSGGINTTSWHNVNATFHLPAANPTSTPIKLRLWCSTAIDNAKNLFIDRAGMAQMAQMYGSGAGGGPFVAAFSGNTQTLVNDFWTLALSNTWGAWIQHFQRLFNMTALGLRLPTTGGSTISTGLIV